MSLRGKILIVSGVVLVVAALSAVVRHYQLRAATEAYIAELKAKGEPMELSQVLPPPVPPDRDGTSIFLQATALLEADRSLLQTNYGSAMRMVAPGKAIICSKQLEVRDNEATNTWEEMAAAVAQNSNAITLLTRLIDKPDFDFQFKYEQGFVDFDYSNLHMVESRKAGRRLQAAALCDTHRGDTISAVADLRAILALVKALRDERLVISELVRIAIANNAVSASWEVLQSTNLTDGQLAALQADWLSLDFVRAEADALAMERALGLITVAKWRSSDAAFQRYFDLQTGARDAMGFSKETATARNKAKMRARIFAWRYWWSYPDELRSLKGYEVLIDTLRSVETNGSFEVALASQDAALEKLGISPLDSSFDSLLTGKTDFHFMLSESIVTLGGVARKVMRIEAAKRIVLTAIALKRYQLEHGGYPAGLNALVPGFLSSVPLDPVDGRPLRYRRNADGTFLLYSVGENGQDDGGDPSLEKGVAAASYYWQSPHTLDWVWPQPATPEEVRNFYEHPPK